MTDSTPVSLRRVRRRIVQKLVEAGLAADAAREMEIAAGEALSNVYRHAYPSRIGLVFVDVFHANGSAGVTIMDLGVATTAAEIPSSLPSGLQPDGRGLYLMRLFADDVQIRVNHVGHGLAVTITKSLKPRRVSAA